MTRYLLARRIVHVHVRAVRDAERARRRGRGRSKRAAQRRRVRELVDAAFDLVRGLGDVHAIVANDGIILIEDSRLAANRQASSSGEAGAKP